MSNRIIVTGVPVDPMSFNQAAYRAGDLLDDGGRHVIVTPNPEMAVLASKDAEFSEILRSADLALADGYGLRLAARLDGERIPETITGTDFMLALALLADQRGMSVYFMGGQGNAAQKTAEVFQKQFPSLKVADAENGGRIKFHHHRWSEDEHLLEHINETKPDILFVALGHGKQERWIHDHLKKMPKVRIAIGVGGAFAYYSGKFPRPPKFLRMLHLEWLWRLILQPWRAPRIFTALVLFPILALKLRRKRVK